METQVLVAHTGQRLRMDPDQFSTVDDFKAHVAKQTSIPVQQLIVLTLQGKAVKNQTLHQESEICLYDRRVNSTTNPAPVPEISPPKRYSIPKAPDYIESADDVSAWQDLCHARRAWALRLAEDCARLSTSASDRYAEMDVMLKCLDAAVVNMEHSVKQIEPRYEELKNWALPALDDHARLAANWERHLAIARGVPISPAMVRFMTSRDLKKKQATLEDLIELDTARKAGSLAHTSEKKFRGKANDLDKSANAMYEGLQQLIGEFDALVNRSTMSHGHEPAQLLEDIEAVARKIDTDAQIVREYGNTQRDLSQASKTAQNHTQHLIPSLKRRAKEMDEMLAYAVQARNATSVDAAELMRRITEITTVHSNVKNQINVLSQSEEDMTTFDYLRLIHQLPYMYASFVSEAIRRREWSDKIKTDSSTLANEMALFQDEESKRRRKWQKTVGGTYGPDKVGTNILGLEVNLLGEEESWPSMAKSDLEDFLEHLQRQRADSETVEEVGKLVNELSSPTKQQSKRLKAFKNGSLHEAALGRSGLMIRGDDDMLRTLQEDKSKMENKLKTAESRVRRLEDLLHRSQAARPSPGSLFGHDRNGSTHSVNPPPVPDDGRRASADTEALQQRIQQLEAELASEKDRATAFEKDINARDTQHDNMRGEMDEINSTKKDLMENMDALKREFVDERKSLEDEINALKVRIEENEDDMEHFGESRQNEKATYDDKVHTLEQEVERLHKDMKDDALKGQGQVDFLRKEARLQRERIESLETQLQEAQDENKNVAKGLEAARVDGETQLKALRELFEQICPDEEMPEDVADMIDVLSSRAGEAIAKLKTADNDMSVLRSDYEQTQEQIKTLKNELLRSQERVASEEASTRHLRENLSEEKARVAALEKDAAEGRSQLDQLRAQISDGETGSESLRKKLDEEEQRLTSMTEELATRQSQVGSLEEELHMFKENLNESRSQVSELTQRLENRTDRTKDLTQRLYSQNDRLTRLLERLGFAVTREGTSMSINKIPRSERGSQSQMQAAHDSSDPGQSNIRRSGTFSSLAPMEGADLELLHWMNTNDADAETEKYDAFMSKLGSFDVDLFGETVYRRVKDIEHMAKKLQRDARAYREKARSLQKDGHEKIAYKQFKEGDLALFLPTKNQTSGAWAAFNVGFPHYFLREQDGHRLRSREWLVARISRIEERVVDLSKSMQKQLPPDTDSLNDNNDDNPFQLSDGLRWYMIDAYEDKPGAPSTPGLGKSTTAATNVEARADMHTHAGKGTSGGGGLGSSGFGGGSKDKQRGTGQQGGIEGVSKVLSKSLESRRSSSNSKKALPFAGVGIGASALKGSALASETNSLRVTTAAAAEETPMGASPPTQQQQQQQHSEQAPSREARQRQEQGQDQQKEAEAEEDDGPSRRDGTDGGSSRQPAARETELESIANIKREQEQSQTRSQASTATNLGREESGTSVDSPSKKSVVWGSLWNVDVSYPDGQGKTRS